MSHILQQGLLITAIGMGLVFLVIIFLWWLMGLMMRVTSKDEGLGMEAPEAPLTSDNTLLDIGRVEAHRRAAGVGVAVGLAIDAHQAQWAKQRAQAEIHRMSPWQSVHRAWQLEQQDKRG
jgi:Na+-transporting methylmalonyl-CoA/oxaloacetate decarboxylase gamma subunit